MVKMGGEKAQKGKRKGRKKEKRKERVDSMKMDSI